MNNSFDKLGLDNRLVDALKKESITIPTPIQEKAIPPALENKDVIGQAQTGSGKTLAYLLPIFQKINTEAREMQAIVLAPTHELAMQISNQVKLLSENSGIPVTSTVIIGEVNIERQKEKLKQKPHIIVGSPGRILELIKAKKISAHTVKTIVVDEGDRLLDKNNVDSVKAIIKATLRERQLMIFSATISEEAVDIAKEIMKEPELIKIEEEKLLNPNISHMYFLAEQRDKIEVLRKLVASIKPKKAIVFVNKADELQILTEKLVFHHINAFSLFGTASKEDRKKAMEGLRSGKIQLLIASDIAARGLDIKGVTHIFNLDLPKDTKDYLHRVGRTGRVNEKGIAISIVTKEELPTIRKIERKYEVNIVPKTIYKGKIWDIEESIDNK